MSYVIKAEIPAKIKYVSFKGASQYIGCQWDIPSYNVKTDGVSISVDMTHICDSSNANSLLTAKNYMEHHHLNKSKVIIEEEFENVIIINPRILNCDYGYQGKTYKTLLNNKYCIELKDDVLMDVILNSGVEANGTLKGEFIWAKISNQMKLIRIGSTLHSMVLKSVERKEKTILDSKDFKVGKIYEDFRGNKSVFLGFVNTILLSNKNRVKFDYSIPYYAPGGYQDVIAKYKAKYEFSMKKVKNKMLFYRIYNDDKTKINATLQDVDALYNNQWYLELKDKHNFIEEVDNVSVPDNIISNVRDCFLKRIKDLFSKNNYEEYNIESNIASYSKYFNISKVEDGFSKVPDFSKYVMFI